MKKTTLMAMLLTVLGSANALEPQGVELRLSAQGFTANPLVIPSDQKVKVNFINESDQAVEIEGDTLDIEVPLAPHASRVVYLGPLKKGSYSLENEYQDTQKTTLISQ